MVKYSDMYFEDTPCQLSRVLHLRVIALVLKCVYWKTIVICMRLLLQTGVLSAYFGTQHQFFSVNASAFHLI